MPLDHLWATWREVYLSGESVSAVPPGKGSIFERILHSGLPDEQTFVLWRGAHCGALLNIYPYCSGHLMVLPLHARADLADLGADEAAELWEGVQAGVAAVRGAYAPGGVNVGMNLGRAAGAGVPDHLHVHVLPRWDGDTNFMTTVAGTRVSPEALHTTYAKLKAAWPG